MDNVLSPSEIRHVFLEDLQSGSYCWTIPERAELVMVMGIFTPTELTIEVKLTGPQAKFSLHGLVATSEGQTTITVNQHHQAPDTQSKALLKGLFANNAQSKLQGLVTIDAVAQNSHASQYHKALLLDSRAGCKAIPSFAVGNHQVRCNHGAAVGKLAIDQLAYLQSRGMSETLARQLLIQGFAQEVVEQLEIDQQQRWLQKVAGVT